jgi:O-methyltransferase
VIRQTIFRTLQYVTSPWASQLPLSRVPPWLGRLQEIKVPRGAAKNEVRACSGGANINILIALLNDGVYRGSTLIPTGLFLKQRAWNKVVYGFDSFEGFDASVSSEIALGGAPDSEKRRGGFGDTSLEYVDAKVRRFRLQRHVQLVKGYLSTTLAHYSALTFSFVHLDVDIYESYKIGLEFFYPRVTSGGVILFDEYNDPPWPGCNKAVDEFFADKPETLREIERDNHVKYFIRKL